MTNRQTVSLSDCLAALDERDELRAENERLRADLDGLMVESHSSRKAMERARHKIDELRAALTSATGQADPKCCTVCQELLARPKE